MNILPEEVVQLALNGYLVICSNNRQLMELKKAIEPHIGNKAEFYPKIATIDSWCKYQFEQNFEKRILSNYQIESLFEKIIAANLSEYEVSNVPSAAKEATRALLSLESNLVDLEDLVPETIESEAFLKWFSIYKEHSDARDYVSISGAKRLVSTLFEKDDYHISKRIALYGFLKVEKVNELLIECYKKHTQNVVTLHESTLSVTSPAKSTCYNVEDEINKCIDFVKVLRESNPSATICITSPILTDIQNQLSYQLLREFGSISESLDEICHSSLGEPLFDVPEIQSFLYLLDYEKGKSISNFERDYVDSSKCISRPFEEYTEIETCIKDYETNNNAIVYTELIDAIIEKYEWCKQSEARHEQLTARFAECIKIVEDGDVTNQKLTLEEFTFKVIELLKNTPFKLKVEKEHNLYVLGLYEVIGLNFDHVWVIGANANYWPNKVKTNKMIPQTAQEKHGIVLKDEDESALFNSITDRIVSSCYELYFSFSKFYEERELLEPSVFSSEVELTLNESKKGFLPTDKVEAESIDDTFGTEIPLHSNCPGGTQYIKNHALCPFKSHYMSRFKCIKTELNPSFLENKAHGDLVHHTLEKLYEQYTSSEALNDEPCEKLDASIVNHINKSIEDYKAESTLPEWFFNNEAIRIRLLILQFAAKEMRRDFKVIGLEKKVYVTFATLKFTLFIDRIEEETVNKGKENQKILRLVSDHKTGKEQANDWFKEPCPEPQLPIYSLIENVDGAIYNILREDGVTYKGFVRDGQGKSFGVETPRAGSVDWETQLADWKLQMETTVENIQKGFSIPNPLSNNTCDFCDLKRACRLNEQNT